MTTSIISQAANIAWAAAATACKKIDENIQGVFKPGITQQERNQQIVSLALRTLAAGTLLYVGSSIVLPYIAFAASCVVGCVTGVVKLAIKVAILVGCYKLFTNPNSSFFTVEVPKMVNKAYLSVVNFLAPTQK